MTAASRPCDRGRRLRAPYAFGGAAVALQLAVPLAPDEGVLFHGVMRLRGQGPLARPALLRLTRPRLAVLAHFAFRPDEVLELPRSSVQGLEMAQDELRIAWLDQDTDVQVTRLHRWTGRAAPDRPVTDAHEVATLLGDWLAGRNGGAAAPRTHDAN